MSAPRRRLLLGEVEAELQPGLGVGRAASGCETRRWRAGSCSRSPAEVGSSTTLASVPNCTTATVSSSRRPASKRAERGLDASRGGLRMPIEPDVSITKVSDTGLRSSIRHGAALEPDAHQDGAFLGEGRGRAIHVDREGRIPRRVVAAGKALTYSSTRTLSGSGQPAVAEEATRDAPGRRVDVHRERGVGVGPDIGRRVDAGVPKVVSGYGSCGATSVGSGYGCCGGGAGVGSGLGARTPVVAAGSGLPAPRCRSQCSQPGPPPGGSSDRTTATGLGAWTWFSSGPVGARRRPDFGCGRPPASRHRHLRRLPGALRAAWCTSSDRTSGTLRPQARTGKETSTAFTFVSARLRSRPPRYPRGMDWRREGY